LAHRRHRLLRLAAREGLGHDVVRHVMEVHDAIVLGVGLG
jgi:hypothetical protein